MSWSKRRRDSFDSSSSSSFVTTTPSSLTLNDGVSHFVMLGTSAVTLQPLMSASTSKGISSLYLLLNFSEVRAGRAGPVVVTESKSHLL